MAPAGEERPVEPVRKIVELAKHVGTVNAGQGKIVVIARQTVAPALTVAMAPVAAVKTVATVQMTVVLVNTVAMDRVTLEREKAVATVQETVAPAHLSVEMEVVTGLKAVALARETVDHVVATAPAKLGGVKTVKRATLIAEVVPQSLSTYSSMVVILKCICLPTAQLT
jgi:hypothetical protein